MASMTNYLEAALSAAVLRGGTYTGGRLYVGLFVTGFPPTDAAVGTEASYTSYARASFRSGAQVNSDQFDVIDGSGVSQSSQLVEFPTNTGTAQAVSHWGVFDASSGGNMLFHGPLGAAKTIDPADTPSFPIATFKFTWD